MNRISIILENPTFGYFFKKLRRMSSQNLDFSMYLNVKMEFITHSMQKNMKTLFSEDKGQIANWQNQT